MENKFGPFLKIMVQLSQSPRERQNPFLQGKLFEVRQFVEGIKLLTVLFKTNK